VDGVVCFLFTFGCAHHRCMRVEDKKIIALDFDGTLTTHEYPSIGSDVGAFPWLRRASSKSKYILFTMRSGDELQQAIEYINNKGIELWGINENPEQKSWTSSPKVYAHQYIDDASIGIPLIYPKTPYDRPYVNWDVVGPMLLKYLQIQSC
jgi:hypothetical protein